MKYAHQADYGPNGKLAPGRAAYEFYPTQPEATRALLSVESFDGPVWECACGEGHMARELKAAGYDVVSTDLIDRGYGEAGVDFLRETTHRAKHIITNPPYGDGLADLFVGRALILARQTGGSVAMLLNLASLCHPRRHRKFLHTPPAAIYYLDDLTCYPNGDPRQATRTTAKAALLLACLERRTYGPTDLLVALDLRISRLNAFVMPPTTKAMSVRKANPRQTLRRFRLIQYDGR